jgi:hypothetical protein
MVKIDELTDLKAIAILLLFFVHSNLQISANLFSVALQEWMLSAFFFVSGYLTWVSFSNRAYSIRAFSLHRMIQVYIPFVLIMALYVFTPTIVYYSVPGFLSHASFLSVFQVFAQGQFEMYQFWFVPDLLAFSALYIVMAKYPSRTLWRLSIIAAIFIFDLASYTYAAPFRLEYNIGLYLVVFAFGYEVATNRLIEKLRHLKISLIPLLALSAASAYVLFTYLANPDLSTAAARASYFSASWIQSITLTIPLILIALAAVYHIRRRYPKSRIYRLSLILAGSSLFIYLLEGYISPIVGVYIFDANWYVTDITGPALLPSILLRIAIVTPIAYGLQKGYNIAGRKLEALVLGHSQYFRKSQVKTENTTAAKKEHPEPPQHAPG